MLMYKITSRAYGFNKVFQLNYFVYISLNNENTYTEVLNRGSNLDNCCTMTLIFCPLSWICQWKFQGAQRTNSCTSKQHTPRMGHCYSCQSNLSRLNITQNLKTYTEENLSYFCSLTVYIKDWGLINLRWFITGVTDSPGSLKPLLGFYQILQHKYSCHQVL